VKRTATFKLVTSALIAVAVTLLAWVGLSGGVFGGTHLRLVDGLFPSIGPNERIVIVAIDEQTLDPDSGLPAWPWPRDVHAELVERLTDGGARLIGYDVTFSQERGRDDLVFAEAIGEAGNVILSANAEFEGRLGDLPQASELFPPIPVLAERSVGVAHANVIPDPDGVVRTVPPVIDTPDRSLLSSLSLSLFGLSEGLGDQPITLRPDGIQVGNVLIPTGRAHLLDVNFAEGYETYSAASVLADEVPPGAFRNKIVLIGATAQGLGDTRQTPLNKAEGQAGVTIHANALNTMLTGAYLFPDGLALTLATVFAMAFLVAGAVSSVRIWLSPIGALGLGLAYYLVAFWRFDRGHVMNLVYPALAVVASFLAALAVRYFTEERERRRVTRVFGRYVASDVVEEVLAAPERALATLEGAERPLSILFADLRGFTSASEGAGPKDVVAALNAYLDAMTRAVNEEQGTIDKFMGDCVMAFWGAPRPTSDHAAKAVRAGLRMLDYIDQAVAEGRAASLTVEGCGVGIATGAAVVGNIGSAERLDYTVIGDTVNTASRICGVAGAGQLVVTEGCADEVRDHFRLADLPPLVVKGKVKPLRVFQVLREGQEAPGFAEGATLDATEDKGHFEPVPEPEESGGYKPSAPAGEREGAEAPARAAGYAPIEPKPQPDRE
jgi:adenylate cyclase